MKILLKNCRIDDEIQNLLIQDDLIAYIGKNNVDADLEYDLNNLYIIPGLIDPHVHVRDLKQADKEDWTSVSNAALRGGISTVFDMPNTRPPTVNLEYLNAKREKAKAAKINYKFNIAATSQNLKELVEVLDTKPDDVAALKMFLAGSNSNEFVDKKEDIKRIFDISLNYNLPLIVHTELQECVNRYSAQVSEPTVFDHNYMRNRECAIKGTELMLKYAKEVGNKLYLAHTSTAEEIDLVQANKDKCTVFCETTPHHLLINDTVLKKAGNFGKVNPPLQTERDNRRIMQGILDGTVDTIGTDHAPHLLSEKKQKYAQAPSGFPGLETCLPLLLNEVNKNSFSMKRLVELTSAKSADIFSLDRRGAVKEGYFADLTVVDMQKEYVVESKKFQSKAKYSPYEGMKLKGDVLMTIVNGKIRYNNYIKS